ncbi:hypothetical protein REPUB_Repub14bG0093500 [Reevesia pubescens]
MLDLVLLIDLIKYRLAYWFKAKWPSTENPFAAASGLCYLSITVMSKQRKSGHCWEAPPQGFLKFNVARSSKGKPDPTGFGRVLRDDKGIIKLFSKNIGRADSNDVEMLAVKEAVVMFAVSNWVRTHGLWIEPCYTCTVDWRPRPNLTMGQ